MLILQPTTFICHFRTVLEKKPHAGPTALLEDDVQEEEPKNNNTLFCKKCRKSITSIDERISVDGAHQHTFANPHGILFEIGCFKTAIGCGYSGIPTDDFSWFKGYRWRIAVCGNCLVHMGWLFIAPENDCFFNGLILDRLTSTP